MDRIQKQQESLVRAAGMEKARADRAVISIISAVVFFHVALTGMVVAKAMGSSKAPVQAVAERAPAN